MTSKLSARIKDAVATQWQRKPVRRVDIDLPFPPSINSLWRRAKKGVTAAGKKRQGMIRSDRYATWARSAGIYINEQRPGRIVGAFTAHILIERKADRTRRDVDNLSKAIFDCLQEHGIIEDDSLAWQVTIGWSHDVHGARVVLEKVHVVLDPSVSRARLAA